MWILPIVALLFAGGAVVAGADGQVANAAVAGAIALVAVGLFLFFRGQRQAQERFLGWLSSNAEAISRGGVARGQIVVRPETELMVYEAASSFFVVTLRLRSRMFLAGEREAGTARWMYSLASLIFGWWGIPWGPIWTIGAVVRNARGGHRLRVADLLRLPVR